MSGGRPQLRDRYTQAERQAVLHAWALDVPISRVEAVRRMRDFGLPMGEGMALLRRLQMDEVVIHGRLWDEDGDEAVVTRVVLVGSLLQPAPFAPESTPPAR